MQVVKPKTKQKLQRINGKYVDLQTKEDKTDEDINHLEDNKTQLDKMNNTSHNLCPSRSQ